VNTSSKRRMKALVVEDDALLRGVLVDLMKEMELECDEAADGKQGLSMLQQNTYDLVLTDIRMPHMTGLEMIVAAGPLDPSTVVAVLSGYHDHSEEDLHDAGIALVLYKPMRLHVLQRMLREALVARR